MTDEFRLCAEAGVAHPCCVPSRQRAAQLEQSRRASAERERATKGSAEGMIRLDGGRFLMGTDTDEGFPADGEGPVREVAIDPFLMDAGPVTNDQFREFAEDAAYPTEAERFGWSFVFRGHIPPEQFDKIVDRQVPGLSWWCKVNGASWMHPEGPDSGIEARGEYPAVHISWNDAAAYCAWAGKRLPREAEWEYAARGGLEGKLYPWGDELTPGGRHLCNIWQGEFPEHDTGEDGYTAPAPARAYPPNGYGLYGITGNTWEWCADWFHPGWHVMATRVNPVGPPGGQGKVMKGGSYLCHYSYCNRYRVAARTSNMPDSSATNTGFRCVRDV
jgi:formylglycine-generating enzyme required for sulfatase activity